MRHLDPITDALQPVTHGVSGADIAAFPSRQIVYDANVQDYTRAATPEGRPVTNKDSDASSDLSACRNDMLGTSHLVLHVLDLSRNEKVPVVIDLH